MAHLITTAIPTDKAAVDHIKENIHKYKKLDITPFIAKDLYKSYILDKHNFVCPTKGCYAPVTCRSIDPSSKNRPTFVNQSLSVNRHSLNGEYHPYNYDSITIGDRAASDSFKFLTSGDTISDLSYRSGFQPLSNSTTSNQVKESSSKQNSTVKNTNKSSATSSSKKEIKVKNHLKSLEDHVEMFYHDPDFEVFTRTSKRPIPIKYMFKHLKNNVFYEDLNTVKYANIYHSWAYLSKPKSESVLRLSFKCPLPSENDETVYP